MKKYVFISLLALVALVFTGCTDCNCKHEPTPECQFHKKTVDLVANASSWSFDDGANMYYCHFDVPEITSTVYNYGEFSVNRKYNSGTQNAYQVALPETTYLQADVEGGTVFYQQHLDYAIGVGFIEVFCTISDFYYDGFSPDAMLFRLQMTY